MLFAQERPRALRDFTIPRSSFEPCYRATYRSGLLEAKREQALRMLERCRVCPRHCEVDRLRDEVGTCRTGRYAWVASYGPHLGEEDCLRGWNGSGTIFFSHCNLKCVFCQNWDISRIGEGKPATPERIAAIMLALQEAGCHNINFVTPEHVVPQIVEALAIAIPQGLRLPLVYNTSAYDSLESLRLMEGLVDIYMPDFKFWDPDVAGKYVKARDYPEAARAAIKEMHRQVGPLVFDEQGLALRGVLVRHLVMPNGLAGTREIMRWLAREVSADTYVNIMDQYHPAGMAHRYPAINRPITSQEYEEALAAAQEAGLWRFDVRWLWRLPRWR